MKLKFLLYHDADDLWFMRFGLGVVWECGPRGEAKEFATRKAAVRILHLAGKHHEGWRVVVMESGEVA